MTADIHGVFRVEAAMVSQTSGRLKHFYRGGAFVYEREGQPNVRSDSSTTWQNR